MVAGEGRHQVYAMARWLTMASLFLCACSYMRPVRAPIAADFHQESGEERDALLQLSSPRSRECLIVFLPGIGDRHEDFRSNGFVEDAEGNGCDLALVDATFEYYLAQQAVRRIGEDVLAEAHRYGYRSIWLVGISLGGYGAVLTARAYPELVDGVVLIAPMLGLPPRADSVIDDVIAAGGLHAWQGGAERTYRHHFQQPELVWSWLREHAFDDFDARPLILAYGTEDSHSTHHAVLADALPQSAVVRSPGAHDWPTWRRLWRDVVARRPWEATSRASSSTRAVDATGRRVALGRSRRFLAPPGVPSDVPR